MGSGKSEVGEEEPGRNLLCFCRVEEKVDNTNPKREALNPKPSIRAFVQEKKNPKEIYRLCLAEESFTF